MYLSKSFFIWKVYIWALFQALTCVISTAICVLKQPRTKNSQASWGNTTEDWNQSKQVRVYFGVSPKIELSRDWTKVSTMEPIAAGKSKLYHYTTVTSQVLCNLWLNWKIYLLLFNMGHMIYLWEWVIALHGRVLIPLGWLQVIFTGHGFKCKSGVYRIYLAHGGFDLVTRESVK
jgi:hypothetical protein